jgi:Trk K+ transport system NAD-binding subunit
VIDPDGPERPRRVRRFVVCGNNPLAYRLVSDLSGHRDREVVVLLRSARAQLGPRIAQLPGVRVVESAELTVAAFDEAGAADAEAVALIDQDDVANIHAALCAQEVNPGVRLVIRFFNMSLGYRIQELFPGSVVLSDSATAAPWFVAAALGEVAPSAVRLPGRPRTSVFVTRRQDVPEARVVCGLADTSDPRHPRRLPADESTADLVLALADEGRPPPPRGLASRRRRLARWWSASVVTPLLVVFTRKLAVAALLLVLLLVVGTVGFALLTGEGWLNAGYLTLLDAAGAAEPDTALPPAAKAVQAAITVVGIAIIPVVTAAVVDSLVSARLVSSTGLPRKVSDHVVLVGLGNVGARVLSQLRDLEIPVVAVDASAEARGMARAARLGVPVVIGDASREEVLRETHLASARALIAVTSNDVVNLEAALHGRVMRPDLRVILRLFDDDLARRVERTFGIDVSRSVSFLAAPTFLAAVLQRHVLTTIPIGRRVLLVAEIPVQPDGALVGRPVSEVPEPGTVRVIALQPHASEHLGLPAPPDHRLAGGDRLVVVATRAGLASVSARASR